MLKLASVVVWVIGGFPLLWLPAPERKDLRFLYYCNALCSYLASKRVKIVKIQICAEDHHQPKYLRRLFWMICSTRPENFGGLKGKSKKKARQQHSAMVRKLWEDQKRSIFAILDKCIHWFEIVKVSTCEESTDCSLSTGLWLPPPEFMFMTQHPGCHLTFGFISDSLWLYQVLLLTRFAAWWIVDDDKAAFDFDSVDGNNLGLTGFNVNLGKKLDGWIDLLKAEGIFVIGLV